MSVFKYACVLIECPITGRYLGVSRKHDWNDFGLPGGSIEENEGVVEAAIRELREETGIVLKPCLLGNIYDDGETITFSVSITDIHHVERRHEGERGIVDWVTREQLCAGTFGGYNKALFKKLGKPVEDFKL